MKKIKKMLASVLSLVLVTAMLIGVPVEASTYAWPGRPGGNGDGSEEWLQGEYGETNGPYQLIGTRKGYVSELNESDGMADDVATGIIDWGISRVHPRFGVVVTVKGLVAALISPNYEGAYYIMNAYVSGRSMKIKTVTGDDRECTTNRHTYVEYVEW